jgi:hypothetical protein
MVMILGITGLRGDLHSQDDQQQDRRTTATVKGDSSVRGEDGGGDSESLMVTRQF